MKDNLTPSLPSKLQCEGNTRLTQLKTIFQYLGKHTATASMVSKATGVPQKCICRYKRDLQLSGKLWEIEKAICKETGFKAWFLTTDPSNAKVQSNQLNQF